MTKWADRLWKTINRLENDGPLKDYLEANAKMVEKIICGMAAGDKKVEENKSAHMAVNIPSAHIADFCNSKYKNGYDLGRYIGDEENVPRRVSVDKSLPIEGDCYKKIYFGALEVNGSGVRFYGDFCLVLKSSAIEPETTILDRNSYDLLRLPISVDSTKAEKIKEEAEKIAGKWENDRGNMAAIKVLESRFPAPRRLTTGQISDAILDDEDYIEILKIGPFEYSDLFEVRTSASDAAAETHIGERLRNGPTPSLAALQWRQRRREAERALNSKGISVRVVASTGREKG